MSIKFVQNAQKIGDDLWVTIPDEIVKNEDIRNGDVLDVDFKRAVKK